MHIASKFALKLQVADLDRSVEYYEEALGFHVLFIQPRDRVAYFNRDSAYLMLREGVYDLIYPHMILTAPYLRGINFEVKFGDIDALYARTLTSSFPVSIPLNERWHRQDMIENGIRQVVVADPDGYLPVFLPLSGRGRYQRDQPADGNSFHFGPGAFAGRPSGAGGDQSAWRFVDFFTANIRNPNTPRPI